jgi:tetratricopeptide (TPR) repeat protein
MHAPKSRRGPAQDSPDDIDAHKLLGRIYLRQLSEGIQRRLLHLALRQRARPGHRRVREDRRAAAQERRGPHGPGPALHRQARPKKAEEQFKTAQAIEPESEEVVLNLARLYAESGDIQHAAKVIEAVPVADRTPRWSLRWARPTTS